MRWHFVAECPRCVAFVIIFRNLFLRSIVSSLCRRPPSNATYSTGSGGGVSFDWKVYDEEMHSSTEVGFPPSRCHRTGTRGADAMWDLLLRSPAPMTLRDWKLFVLYRILSLYAALKIMQMRPS